MLTPDKNVGGGRAGCGRQLAVWFLTARPAGARLGAAARRPARPAHLAGIARLPPSLSECATQQELDLGVRAPQLVVGPSGQSVMDGGIQPKQDALALGHGDTVLAVTSTESRC
jgi:hypothetical protein